MDTQIFLSVRINIRKSLMYIGVHIKSPHVPPAAGGWVQTLAAAVEDGRTGRNTPHLVGVREQRRRQCYEQFNQPIAPPSVDTHRGFAPTRPGKGNARRSLIKTQATCAARPPPRQHRRPGSANATCLSHSRYKKPRATSRVLRCIAAAPNKQTPLSH
jgi:hypothetical protein